MHKARPRTGDEGPGKAKDEDLEQGKYFLGPNATRCGVRVRSAHRVGACAQAACKKEEEGCAALS